MPNFIDNELAAQNVELEVALYLIKKLGGHTAVLTDENGKTSLNWWCGGQLVNITELIDIATGDL